MGVSSPMMRLARNGVQDHYFLIALEVVEAGVRGGLDPPQETPLSAGSLIAALDIFERPFTKRSHRISCHPRYSSAYCRPFAHASRPPGQAARSTRRYLVSHDSDRRTRNRKLGATDAPRVGRRAPLARSTCLYICTSVDAGRCLLFVHPKLMHTCPQRRRRWSSLLLARVPNRPHNPASPPITNLFCYLRCYLFVRHLPARMHRK